MRARLWAAAAAIAGLFLSVTSASAYVLFGEGYVPQPFDTYVQADGSVCCFGHYHSWPRDYLAQTFKATGETPISLTLGLVNILPSDVPPAPFRFRLLVTEALPGFHPGAVLWESGDLEIPASRTDWQEMTIAISGVRLSLGSSYAFILDTYVTLDNETDVGGWFGRGPSAVPGYVDGASYLTGATGDGRLADFAASWDQATMDVAFLMRYDIPEPNTLALLGLGLAGLAVSHRRSQAARNLQNAH